MLGMCECARPQSLTDAIVPDARWSFLLILNLLADAELLAYLPEGMTTTLLNRLKFRKRFISWRRHFGETISHHRRVNPRSGKPQSS
jgi:hypothetical protein